MDVYRRHQITWRLLQRLLRGPVCRKFRLSHEDLSVDGPVLLIPNHVTTWDPLLVAMSLPEKQVYFVASEHLFRLGLVSKLLGWLVAPIPRRKASSGADTVKACLRHLRDGHSICLFAEGEQSWTGCSQPIFPATGKLVKSSGATLVTFRLEGAYLSLPRWARSIRRGRIHGHAVGIYPPEQLKAMSASEINALIERDIAENAWQRQREQPIAYRGKRLAEGLEKLLYLCPNCRRIGTLRSRGKRLFCSCGLTLEWTQEGFFAPSSPFANALEWDEWQRDALQQFQGDEDGLLFFDEPLQLSRISLSHEEERLGEKRLSQYADRLSFGEYVFPLVELSSMAMVKDDLLLFSFRDAYYEIRSKAGHNLRKYLEIWRTDRDGLLKR